KKWKKKRKRNNRNQPPSVRRMNGRARKSPAPMRKFQKRKGVLWLNGAVSETVRLNKTGMDNGIVPGMRDNGKPMAPNRPFMRRFRLPVTAVLTVPSGRP